MDESIALMRPGGENECLQQGDACIQSGRYEEALTHYNSVRGQLRSWTPLKLRQAACLIALCDADRAVRILSPVLRTEPENIEVAALLARAYRESGRFQKSLALAESALVREPRHLGALDAAFLAASIMGDVERSLAHLRTLDQAERTPKRASYYLYHLLFSHLPRRQLEAEYLRRSHIYEPPEKPLSAASTVPPRRRPRRLRIGYVSALFDGHRDCLEPMLQCHDRRRFEVHAFADPCRRPTRAAELRTLADAWHDTAGLTNQQLADRIRKRAIHILVDCDGHFSSGTRLGLYFLRPAPIQVSFLYPMRTGIPAIDYQISDHCLSPAPEPREFEKLVLLPQFACHSAPPAHPGPGPLPALSNGYVTFGSFNQPMKLNSAVIDAWAEILRRLPGSRLIMQSRMGPVEGPALPDVEKRLLGMFRARRVDGRRVRIEGDRELAEHMAMYNKVDIALDSFPHNGMRTTFMALWMGVPVLTRCGDSMVSRMGASLNRVAGLADWTAADSASYVELALWKARDLEALARLRGQMRGRLAETPLMDAKAFTGHLEAAFDWMWKERMGSR